MACAVLLSNVVTTVDANSGNLPLSKSKQEPSAFQSITSTARRIFSSFPSPVQLDAAQPSSTISTLNVSDPVPANGIDEIVLTATVRDENSNPVSGVKVIFSVSGDISSITYDGEVTNSSGNISARIKSNVIGPKPVTAYIVGSTSTAISQSGTAIFSGGTISGRTFDDKNRNGQMDSGEKGVLGITISLKNLSTNEVVSTATGADGSYAFEGLEGGRYQIVANPMQEYGVDANASEVNLAEFETSVNHDFGLFEAAMITGSAYNDFNQNRIRDSGESGLEGATVTASNSTNTKSAQTDKEGKYEIEVYQERPAGPANFTFASTGYEITQSLSSLIYNGNLKKQLTLWIPRITLKTTILKRPAMYLIHRHTRRITILRPVHWEAGRQIVFLLQVEVIMARLQPTDRQGGQDIYCPHPSRFRWTHRA